MENLLDFSLSIIYDMQLILLGGFTSEKYESVGTNIVDLAMKNVASFTTDVNVYQRVTMRLELGGIMATLNILYITILGSNG